MSPEVRSMIDLRHSAEQRGHYSPLGRLLSMQTDKGTIVWPSEQGEGVGPDLALCSPVPLPEKDAGSVVFRVMAHDELGDFGLLVLGQWFGLPLLRTNFINSVTGQKVPCLRCRHACDICDGSGKKQCEGVACGGRGTVPGPGEHCPAPNCAAQTGKPKPECEKCGGSGWYAGLITCPMCLGSGKMTCSRCRGTGRFATGRVNGSTDWTLPKCKACDGTGWKGSFIKQDLAKFTNARLLRIDRYKTPVSKHKKGGEFLALGPILNFIVQDFTTNRPRSFDVQRDDKGDLLFLLVPASPRQKPQKAYLVGGVVRERTRESGAA